MSSRTVRDLVIVAGSLIVITLLHYYTHVAAAEAHVLYRRLYYLPIIYAAFSFGMSGAVVTSVAASILFGVHAWASMGGFVGHVGSENSFEIVLFNVVAVATGGLASRLKRELARSQEISEELERAYVHLERRAMELTQVRRYAEAIVNSVVSGVFTLDEDGTIRTANPAASRILASNGEPLLGRPLCELFESDGGLCEHVARVLENGMPVAGGEVEAMAVGGRRLWLASHVSRLVDADGETLGAVVTIEDQTEVKALTEQLIRTDRLAALGELVAGIAHEIRNPLAIIKGSLQVYGDTPSVSDEFRELSDIVDQEIDRLDKVIKALLDFGRPAPAKMEPVDVARILGETVTLTSKYAEQQGVDLRVDIAEGLPQIVADGDQIKQVLVNLISNAVQSMPDGGEVLLSTQPDAPDMVSFEVSDTGTGIARAELGKVFDPFHTTKEDGTGLGLTIVHRIVDEHHGRIKVDSEQGRGTSVKVSFPVAVAAEQAPGRSASNP